MTLFIRDGGWVSGPMMLPQRPTLKRLYCQRKHPHGSHCLPKADPGDLTLCAVRAMFDLCPLCDRPDHHLHARHEWLDACMIPPRDVT